MTMILIGYDGSDDAKAAIAHAGVLCPSASATVVTVWEPFATMLARTPAGLGPLAGMGDVGGVAEMDAAAEEAALQRARQGVELADAAGLQAQAATASQHTTIADAILDEALRLDADAIVLGSRGLSGIGSLLLGSVSHRVVQHADRTVIIVPAAEVAQRRRHRREAGEAAIA
jgi:nucleotide-binding universal stress UspA family protein